MRTAVLIERGRATRRRVPYMLLQPSGRPGRHPAVVFVHGLWSSKELLLPQMLPFVAEGFTAVGIDVRGHGERWGSWQRAGMDGLRAKGAHYFMNLIAQVSLESALDLSALVESLRARENVDAQRVGLWGLSLGCHVVLAATPLCQPAAVSAAYGTAAWDRMWELSWPYFHPGQPLPEGPRWRRPVAQLVRRLEPVARAREFLPAALLLLHGRDDLPMVQGMRELHDAVAPHYHADPERLRFQLQPSGHAFNEEAEREMRTWLQRWLA